MYLKVHHIDCLWSLAGSLFEIYDKMCDLFLLSSLFPLEVLSERMKLAYQVIGEEVLRIWNIFSWICIGTRLLVIKRRIKKKKQLSAAADNAYCSIKHIMLSIFLVILATIVVYRLLFHAFTFIAASVFLWNAFFLKCFDQSWIYNDAAAALTATVKAFLVVRETLEDVLSTIPVRARCIRRASKKNCLKFHSAEDKRQQSYVYEEQAGQRASERASKTWKTRYRFVKDWSNSRSRKSYEIQYHRFFFVCLDRWCWCCCLLPVDKKNYSINFFWNDTNRFACNFC